MGFLNSYKRLDNLCRDMNGIGVTGYIQDVEHISNGSYHVPGWKEDISNSSIVAIFEIKSFMKMMLMKVICVPTRM